MSRVAHDARPSLAFARSTPKNFDEFLLVPGTYPIVGCPFRLRVLCGDKSNYLIAILDEQASSEAASGETVESSANTEISLTTEQAIWLRGALDRCLAHESKAEGMAAAPKVEASAQSSDCTRCWGDGVVCDGCLLRGVDCTCHTANYTPALCPECCATTND